jgi:hypothetical protein
VLTAINEARQPTPQQQRPHPTLVLISKGRGGRRGTPQRRQQRGRQGRLAPPLTAASHCSQGGFGVLMADNDGGEGGTGDEGTTRRPPPRLRAAAHRVVGGCVRCEGDEGTANTSTLPPLLRALARRVVRVLLAVSPHLHHTTDDTPPAPSLTSNCSWGGSWVERR